MSGCLQSFRMSNNQIDEYYTSHPPRPIFDTLVFQEKKIFYAQSNNQSHKILFLIHGAPGAWFGYKDYLNDSLLLTKYKVIVADRFGYNHSDRKIAGISAQAEAFHALLSQFKDFDITILGRSYGAAIAAKMAIKYPEMVKELYLVSPACAPNLEKFWWFSKPVNTGFVKAFLPYFINKASEEKFAHREELLKIEPEWEKIHCPVTILQGGKDWIIDTKNGAYLDSVLTNAPKKFIFLPENGHLITAERKDLLKELLLKQ